MPDVSLWNACNNKCIMCTNDEDFSKSPTSLYTLKFQIKKLEQYLMGDRYVYWKNNDNADYFSITGGEPTLHPNFFQLLVYFRKRVPGKSIVLLSNGRRFSNPNWTNKFIKIAKPPFCIAISLYGSSPLIHDSITRTKGSYRETIQGIKNIYKHSRGQELEIRLVIHKMNVKDLKNLLRLLLKLLPDTSKYRIVIIHYEIEGQALKNHKKIPLKLTESAKVINKLKRLLFKFKDFRLYHFPLCIVDKKLRKFCWITLPTEERIYPDKCKTCVLRNSCLGLMLEYYKIFGDSELKTILKTEVRG